MAVHILDAPVRRWHCPQCGHSDATREPKPHSRFHTCPRLGFMSAPMLPAGTKGKLEIVERQDYIGREDVQLSEDRRPIQSVVTTRDDGQDCTVYAPTARAEIG